MFNKLRTNILPLQCTLAKLMRRGHQHFERASMSYAIQYWNPLFFTLVCLLSYIWLDCRGALGRTGLLHAMFCRALSLLVLGISFGWLICEQVWWPLFIYISFWNPFNSAFSNEWFTSKKWNLICDKYLSSNLIRIVLTVLASYRCCFHFNSSNKKY